MPIHVSKKHIQKYFDEFSYRINRSQSKKTIWHNIILKMISNIPISKKQIVYGLKLVTQKFY